MMLVAAIELFTSGDASCRVSVEVMTPLADSAVGEKEQVMPAGIVEGHVSAIAAAVRTVPLVGVTETTAVPVPLGERVSEPGAMVAVNDPDRGMVREGMAEARYVVSPEYVAVMMLLPS